jgi:hypothetical protein
LTQRIEIEIESQIKIKIKIIKIGNKVYIRDKDRNWDRN